MKIVQQNVLLVSKSFIHEERKKKSFKRKHFLRKEDKDNNKKKKIFTSCSDIASNRTNAVIGMNVIHLFKIFSLSFFALNDFLLFLLWAFNYLIHDLLTIDLQRPDVVNATFPGINRRKNGNFKMLFQRFTISKCFSFAIS